MSKSDKFLAGVVLGAFLLNWLKQFRFETVQSGTDTPPQDPHYIDEITGIGYYLAPPQPIAEQWWENLHLPNKPIGEEGLRYIGTMLSAGEPLLKQPATSTEYWFPGEMVFTVSGQPGSGFAEILIQGNLVRGTQSQLDISTIRRIDVVTSTWSP